MQNSLEQREQWLFNLVLSWVESHQSSENISLQALTGDASSRRYFDIIGVDGNYLAVDTPLENRPEQFVKTSLLLKKLDINCPDVLCIDFKLGLMIIDKITPSLSLYNYLKQNRHSPNNIRKILNYCIYNLIKLHSVDKPPEWVYIFDRATIMKEVKLFDIWFLDGLLKAHISPTETLNLQRFYAKICDDLLQQPQVLVHRDYHCKNILVNANQQTVLLDFQDAMWGPITYDIVSLAYDCYIDYSPEEKNNLCKNFAQRMLDHKLITEYDITQFNNWVLWMVLQRYLKVIGIFSRLYLRDKKPQYLCYIPRLLNTLIVITKNMSELSNVHQIFSLIIHPQFYSSTYYHHEDSILSIRTP